MDREATAELVVVGYYLSEKKEHSLRSRDYLNERVEEGVVYKRIDSVADLPPLPPWDVLIHKSSNEMATSYNDEKTSTRLNHLRLIRSRYPSLPFIDEIDKVQSLSSRRYMNDVLVEVCRQEGFDSVTTARNVYVDGDYDLVEAMESAGLKLPLICKSGVSAGQSDSHIMTVVFNKEGLRELKGPIVLQEYLNHYETLYKVFVLGDDLHIACRASLESVNHSCNLSAMRNVTFDSQKSFPSFSKPGVFLNNTIDIPHTSSEELLQDKLKILKRFTVKLREISGLSLFGYDVFFSERDGNLVVIDLNYFPSYKEYPHFGSGLRKYLRQVATSAKKGV